MASAVRGLLPGNHVPGAGIQEASQQLGQASKSLTALTEDLAHGGLQKRLSGSGPAPNGPRRTPYSPWLSTPYVKVHFALALYHVPVNFRLT